MDKIGEVIGPKGKVINTIQQETGADIAVDDDGSVGIVTIGCRRRRRRWRRPGARILAIVDPPKAEVGAIYTGRVVNITKFGAFVNILPGRDGLVHISKLGPRQADQRRRGRARPRPGDRGPRRRDRREGQGQPHPDRRGRRGRRRRAERQRRRWTPAGRRRFSGAKPSSSAASGASVSFEDAFDAEAREQFGDLGPAASAAPSGGGSRSSGSGDRGRGPRRSGGNGGGRRR